MTTKALMNAIKRAGGTAEIIIENKTGYNDQLWTSKRLRGELNGYDIELDRENCRYCTTRKISDRDFFDPGSDYNPNGFYFCYSIKEVIESCRLEIR